MAVNQNHTENRRGVIVPYGESILKQCQDVVLSFPQHPGQPGRSNLFSGTKMGMVFLTSYRVIFVTSHTVRDPLLSFMMPLDLLRDCTVEQPFLSPNYIKGTITAVPDGGWEGQAIFKLSFRKGGAISFFQSMSQATAAAATGVPLGNANYWYGGPAIYVVVPEQMTTECTPETPCPAIFYASAPMRPPPTEYGTHPVRYRATAMRDETLQQGRGAPPPGYRPGAPPAAYGPGAPPAAYGPGAPPAAYGPGAPPPAYGPGAPPAAYGPGAPPAAYGPGAPPPAYGPGAPPPAYGPGAPPAAYGPGAPPPEYGAPPAGSRTQP